MISIVQILVALFITSKISFVIVQSNNNINDLLLNHNNSLSKKYHQSGFSRDNPNSVELMILYRERELFHRSVTAAKSAGYSIRGFYHTSTWQNMWEAVILEQIQLLDGKRKVPVDVDKPDTAYKWHDDLWTSLLRASESLFVNVAGPVIEDLHKVTELIKGAGLASLDKIQFGFNKTIGRHDFNGANEAKKKEFLANEQLSSGEYSTIDLLQKYCIEKTNAGEKALVYYIHSKSGCCYKDFGSKEKNPRASWREEMNAFNIEFPSICLRALLKGYNTCGVENQDAHYSGNFWWADCNHIANLNPLNNRYDAWSCEFFVQKYSVDFELARKIGYHCGYSMFNCGRNLYDNDCWRELYRDRLLNLETRYKLLPSFRGTGGKHGKAHDNDTQACIDIRSTRVKYDQNQKEVREKFLHVK